MRWVCRVSGSGRAFVAIRADGGTMFARGSGMRGVALGVNGGVRGGLWGISICYYYGCGNVFVVIITSQLFAQLLHI